MRWRERGTGTRVFGTVIAILAAIGGCGKTPPPPPPPPPPPEHDLCLEATSRLNWYEDRSHTVFVRIFQLSEVGAFGQADIDHLLDPQAHLAGAEGAAFDRTMYPGAKATVRFTQQPAA